MCPQEYEPTIHLLSVRTGAWPARQSGWCAGKTHHRPPTTTSKPGESSGPTLLTIQHQIIAARKTGQFHSLPAQQNNSLYKSVLQALCAGWLQGRRQCPAHTNTTATQNSMLCVAGPWLNSSAPCSSPCCPALHGGGDKTRPCTRRCSHIHCSRSCNQHTHRC